MAGFVKHTWSWEARRQKKILPHNSRLPSLPDSSRLIFQSFKTLFPVESMDRAFALTSKDINLCCHDHPIYFLQDQVKKKVKFERLRNGEPQWHLYDHYPPIKTG